MVRTHMSGPHPKKIVLVVGPTASGKTGLSLDLAEAFNGELVNADSVQFYRGFDIGSCKPTAKELTRAHHHLIDALDPNDPCDAGRFVRLADEAIANITSRGKLPIVVGGTGLYFRALVHGLTEIPPIAPEVRQRVLDEVAEGGPEAAHDRLTQVDPVAAERIAPTDRQRISRALEVYDQTGRALSEFQEKHRFAERRYEALGLAIKWPREQLHERIGRRVGMMLDDGFVAEVRTLLAAGHSASLRPMRSLGYREMVEHLTKGVSLEQTLEAIARGHRQYAKRQRTWFRKHDEVHWLPPEGTKRAIELVRDFTA